MKLALLLLTVAGASATPSLRQADAGRVYLMSAESVATVPQFRVLGEGDSVLLVAAPASSPAPIDARHWGADARTWILDVHQGAGTDLKEPELERLRAAGRVFLGPGNARQWAVAFGAGSKPTPLGRALLAAWRAGASVAAFGDAAVVLADSYPTAPGENEERTERNPRALDRPRLAPGLGLLDLGVLDTAARSRGSLEDLVASVLQGGVDLAFFLPAGAALSYDPRTGELIGLGREPALIVDARSARRTRGALSSAELVFVDGMQAWDPRATPDGRAAHASPPAEVAREVDDPWEAGAWTAAGAGGTRAFVLAARTGRVEFRPLAASRAARSSPPAAPRGLLEVARP